MSLISNATGAYGLTGVENSARIVDPFLTTGAVSEGDVLVFDVLTADGVVTVHSADVSADNSALIAGVATEDAASGEVVLAVTYGPAIVNIDDATVAAGDLMTFHATADGAADGTAGTAALLNGDYFATALSANDVGGTNKAIVYVGKT